MSTSRGLLALVDDDALRADLDRIAAAAGIRVIHVTEPSGRKSWAAAAAVVVDVPGAVRCAELVLPRRDSLFVVTRSQPCAAEWPALMALGARDVLVLPTHEADLVAALSDAADAGRHLRRRGPVVAVIGARGGAGASVFATALAHQAADALLLDVDPWGGGLDLLLGSEDVPGMRWPDLTLQTGRIGWSALRAALPVRRDVAVLSMGRAGGAVDAAALDAVVDAGSRGGATVICDLPRRATPAVEMALASADLVVLVTPADVRSCAAAGSIGAWLTSANANVGLVVRGPAPGGLTAGEVAASVGLPLLAGMRVQPGLAGALEHAGLEPRRRSPVAAAARRVLATLDQLLPERAA